MRIIFVFLLIFLSACSSAQPKPEQIHWEVSSTFESDGYVMRGVEKKIAIIDIPLAAGEPTKLEWHFWGPVEDVTGKLTVFGTYQETGKKDTVIPSTFIIPAKPLNGADNHFASMLALPSPGLWKLDAFIDDGLFGSIIVEVK